MSFLIEQPETKIIYLPSGDELDLDNLKRNEYYLLIEHDKTHAYSLWQKLDECYKCLSTPVIPFIESGKVNIMNSEHASSWEIYINTFTVPGEHYCSLKPQVGEFGVHKLILNRNNCVIENIAEPVNIYFPILTVILIYTLVAFILYVFFYLYDVFLCTERDRNNETKKRVKSLDTFRGISIVIMIFVNYGGGGYHFFDHAVWNGLNIADLVFPWFLWIMGVCIPISINSALKRSESKSNIFFNIIRRSIILFVLGLCLNKIDTLDTLRIFGVLQRFSLCYLIVGSVNLIFATNDIPNKNLEFGADILFLLPQWGIILLFVTLHTLLIFILPVADCPETGYLGPGGMHNWHLNPNCSGGVSNYIDKLILGENHLYQKPTFTSIYYSYSDDVHVPFDPEGLFSTLPAILQVFMGVQAGTTIIIYKGNIKRVINWLIWGIINGILGAGLCGLSKEDGIIPINKNLWSLSFVFTTTCFAFVLLTLLYVIIDIQKFWNGKPFLYAGMNAIILYVGHNLTYDMFPFQWGIVEPNLHFQLLSEAVWGTIIWILISYWLYRIKFFLSL